MKELPYNCIECTFKKNDNRPFTDSRAYCGKAKTKPYITVGVVNLYHDNFIKRTESCPLSKTENK